MEEEEYAKTVQEVSKFGTKALEIGEVLGGFLSRIFGTLPEDLIGVVGGDYLRHIRIRNAAKLQKRTDEILEERGIKNDTQPLSPNIALPLLNAAQNESREELQELWARLLANAMDPNRSGAIRQSVIAVVRDFDPLDAIIMEKAYQLPGPRGESRNVTDLPKELKVTRDEFEVSLSNLKRLDCIGLERNLGQTHTPVTTLINFTHLGREIMRACSL